MWGIAGGIVALVISGGSILAVIANPSAYSDAASLGGILAGIIIGVIVGSLISTIGGYATMVKIILESSEETRKPPAA